MNTPTIRENVERTLLQDIIKAAQALNYNPEQVGMAVHTYATFIGAAQVAQPIELTRTATGIRSIDDHSSLVDEQNEVIGYLQRLLGDCPLLHTTTQYQSEKHWIRKARQALGPIYAEPQGLTPSPQSEVAAWQETAAQAQKGLEFYQAIVHQIGNLFGDQAKKCDDGTYAPDVLALKVPELVDDAMARLKASDNLAAKLDCDLSNVRTMARRLMEFHTKLSGLLRQKGDHEGSLNLDVLVERVKFILAPRELPKTFQSNLRKLQTDLEELVEVALNDCEISTRTHGSLAGISMIVEQVVADL